MIEKGSLEALLNLFDLGASTAENDPLLEVAKIETQEFFDLYYKDRIDIVKGIKGSGKTALYRVFYFLKNYSVKEKNLFSIFGVEASGDPVFRLFYQEFEDYSEIEFENFWNIYFILLVYNLIEENETLKNKLNKDKEEIKKIINALGIRIEKHGYSLKDSISGIQKLLRSSGIKAGVKTDVDKNMNPTAFTPILEIEPKTLENLKVKPMYVAEFRDKVAEILKKHDIKIWILLDRLDEVFPHRSTIEKNGLKGLLKCSYNLSCPNLRVKIFLRDDILDFVSSDGFTAFTHVSDRCSSTMTWSKEELLLLIVKRLGAIDEIRNYFQIDNSELEDLDYRYKVFYSVFPSKIGKMYTMDWIFSNCADGNGVVTPRDIIDFFKSAKTEQLKAFKINHREQEYLISPNFFKIALNELSKHKKSYFLYSEFPHLKSIFLNFEGGFSEYDTAQLKELLGENHPVIIEDLKSIGFLKYVPKSGTYKIPIIWRKGLNIRRKKAEKRK